MNNPILRKKSQSNITPDVLMTDNPPHPVLAILLLSAKAEHILSQCHVEGTQKVSVIIVVLIVGSSSDLLLFLFLLSGRSPATFARTPRLPFPFSRHADGLIRWLVNLIGWFDWLIWLVNFGGYHRSIDWSTECKKSFDGHDRLLDWLVAGWLNDLAGLIILVDSVQMVSLVGGLGGRGY